MAGFRHLFLDHRTLSAWLIVCALAMKILVPAGFMPVVSGGTVTIQICGGTMPAEIPATHMAKAMPGMTHHQNDKTDHQGREMPCAFSGLSAPLLAAVDTLLLAVAIAFIIRPPLRGPPRVPA
jgi:hypothetical protein